MWRARAGESGLGTGTDTVFGGGGSRSPGGAAARPRAAGPSDLSGTARSPPFRPRRPNPPPPRRIGQALKDHLPRLFKIKVYRVPKTLQGEIVLSAEPGQSKTPPGYRRPQS